MVAESRQAFALATTEYRVGPEDMLMRGCWRWSDSTKRSEEGGREEHAMTNQPKRRGISLCRAR